jgi:cardiolipin-specific phospholipase
MFWSCNISENLEQLRLAESKLMIFAKSFGDRPSGSFEISSFDTPIPSKALPLKEKKGSSSSDHDKEELHIHSVCVKATRTNNENSNTTRTPLVIMHGYMNGAMYFYRNLVGLTNYFDTVYSLDTLGCGLSSRCPDLVSKRIVDQSQETVERLFVESLEAWRKANNINKMILAGHSMGGHLSIAYSERYPQHVQQLVLLSPAGVTHPDPDRTQKFIQQMSWSRRMFVHTARSLFEYGVTPAGFVRTLPTSKGRSWIDSYVENRLSSITNVEEQGAVADYLYYNAMIPGCQEDMLNKILLPTAHGRAPTVDRIPYLKVPKVSFVYGDHDWMDVEGGKEVAEQVTRIQTNGPAVDVYQVKNAGHMLMIDNWQGFHASVVTMCSGGKAFTPFPTTIRRVVPSS